MTYTEKLLYLLEQSKEEMRPYRIREDVEQAIKKRLMVLGIPIIKENRRLGHRGSVGALLWVIVSTKCPGDGAIHARLRRLTGAEEAALMEHIAAWVPAHGELALLGRILKVEKRSSACLAKFNEGVDYWDTV